jgi:PAS domain S-box-containing protein
MPILVHAEDGEVLAVSRVLTEATGFSSGELRRIEDWLNRAYGSRAGEVAAIIRERFEGGRGGRDLEWPIVTKEGEPRLWAFSASEPRTLPDGRRYVVAAAVDITRHKEHEQAGRRQNEELERRVLLRNRQLSAANRELEKRRNELRRLAARLITAQEETRRGLARELHDDFGQRLAEAAGRLARLPLPAGAGAVLLEEIAAARQSLSALTDDLRELSRQLHPSILEDVGLTVALEELIKGFERTHGICITFSTAGAAPEAGLPPGLELCLYRAAQECLNNVRKHAPSAAAAVSLTWRPAGTVRLVISDTGGGFDVKRRPRGGLGLVSIRERVRSLGGRFQLRSALGKGTVAAIEVPIGNQPLRRGGRSPAQVETMETP